MNPEDMATARDVRRQLEKRAVDACLAVITSTKGFVTVSGTIRRLRSDPYSDINEELEIFRKMVFRSVRDVRGLTIDARIQRVEKAKKEPHEEHQQVPHIPGHVPIPGVGAKKNVQGY
jgi:hypothetical protein